jgi:hypothetical protein
MTCCCTVANTGTLAVQVLAERVPAQNTTLVLSLEDDHREYLDELELKLELEQVQYA